MNVEAARLRHEALSARDHIDATLSQCNPINRRVYELNTAIEDLYRGSPAPAEVHRATQAVIEHINKLQFDMEELPDRLRKRDPQAAELVHKISTGWNTVTGEVGALVEKINGWDPHFSDLAKDLHGAVAELAEVAKKLEA